MVYRLSGPNVLTSSGVLAGGHLPQLVSWTVNVCHTSKSQSDSDILPLINQMTRCF